MSHDISRICILEGSYGRRFSDVFRVAWRIAEEPWICETSKFLTARHTLFSLSPDKRVAGTMNVDEGVLFNRSVTAEPCEGARRGRWDSLPLAQFRRFIAYFSDKDDVYPCLADLGRQNPALQDCEIVLTDRTAVRTTLRVGDLVKQNWDMRLLFHAWSMAMCWPLLSEALDRAGGSPQSGPPLLVEDIQLLYRVSLGKSPQMYSWSGFRLMNHGLVPWCPETCEPLPLMTERGHALLALMHPSGRDPKFFDRTESWFAQWEENRPRAERWIRTWAGRLENRLARPAAVNP